MRPKLNQRILFRKKEYVVSKIDRSQNTGADYIDFISVANNNESVTTDLDNFMKLFIFNPKDKTWHYMKDVIG